MRWRARSAALAMSSRLSPTARITGGKCAAPILRGARRLLRPFIVARFQRALIRSAEGLQPQLLFVCKGQPRRAARDSGRQTRGATTALWWPDVSFFAHGLRSRAPCRTTTGCLRPRPFGMADLEAKFGMSKASFMPHAFHPEVPPQIPLRRQRRRALRLRRLVHRHLVAEEAVAARIARRRPAAGEAQDLGHAVGEGRRDARALGRIARSRLGAEYAKAIRPSRINLRILSEMRKGASSGDLITRAHVSYIPACGGFMLHERTRESRAVFPGRP